MAIPNGAGGYQFNDGNVGESLLYTQGAPSAKTSTTVTLTSDDLAGGLITSTQTGATTLTLPIVVTAGGVTGVNDAVSSAKVNSAFQFSIINLGSSSGDATLSVGSGTGWTIVGSTSVPISTSATFVARKTSDTTWTAYRV